MKAVSQLYGIGIDIGSTTLKVIVLNDAKEVAYKTYTRHKTDINHILISELNTVIERFPQSDFTIRVTGSAGMGIAERIGAPFTQEIVASVKVVNTYYPDVRTLIDLGGEDAKMVFFYPGKQPDIRMNGSCAGGTGAFIDQMADLMHIPVEELGDKASDFEKIYPVASRCGVFAKTDVQNLICRNIPVPDIAASILHTVALQSLTSLARGYDVEPKVLCAGGPLTFIPSLRNAFRELIGINESDMIVPDHGEYFPAWGCALLSGAEETTCDLRALVHRLGTTAKAQKETLPGLFRDIDAYEQWKKDRRIKSLKKREVKEGDDIACFLGIDSGSTTTKILITDEENRVVYTFYESNEGNPLKKLIEGLQQFYDEAKAGGFSFRFVSSAVTGYGEDLVKSALNLDYGLVETMAHLSGAKYVNPEVSFVLDIGGQDMKSIFTQHGLISNIELNEACSSGCGSFLQNFAATMHMDLPAFSHAACLAGYPSDLGSRCTVFMNSKVKQALRESASLGDIAAGLAYSVVKNCLFKVLKISNLNALGDHIVVQGGTFRNDAVYRALELLSGKTVSSTDYPELMGAFGAALYARQMWVQTGKETSFAGLAPLPDLADVATKELQCKGCTNQCTVLRFSFENGNVSYAGNKCEKVFFCKSSKSAGQRKGVNAFDKKNEILFGRAITAHQNALTIGIPRVLNMFENYPFWHALFTGCGFNVALSPESNFTLYQSGVGSVMSENICFPAKLVHGHILSLIRQEVDRIFYPIIPKEVKEFGHSTDSFNCPIVSGYPEVIRSSIDPEGKHGIPFDKPVVIFSDRKALEKACAQYCTSLGVSPSRFAVAFKAALQEKRDTEKKIAHEQKALFEKNIKEGKLTFVVAGRPYHTDPLIHQKVGQILSDLGIDVFTDDVFRVSDNSGFGKLNIVSQWSYPNRVVQSAMEIAKLPRHVQLIQLNSFGCGPDSFFMDETTEVLKQAGKNHTILRIDEIASPGSIRLRLRSLIESLRAMAENPVREPVPFEGYKTTYKKEDRRKTILVPWFADFFSPFIPAIGELAGYRIINMPKTSKMSVEVGLKYGNNEVCYPSTLILGDIISTLKSGKYDLDDTVVAITQTGGQCRATNYIAQIKSGLQNAGLARVPVLAIGSQAIQNEQKAFKVPVLKILNISIYAILYADALQQMYSVTTVRENKKGETKTLFDFYVEKGIEAIRGNDHKRLMKTLEQAVADFNRIPITGCEYNKIGLVGEIFLKYNNYGQAYITDWLRSRNMEVDSPPIIDFLMQYFVNSEVNMANGMNKSTAWGKYLRSVFWKYINKRMSVVEDIMRRYRFYQPVESIYTKAEYASEILDLANQFGEGWMIAAEVACYARRGINKVVCVQPFGCIANHIVAKGIEKRLKKIYPDVNILYLDVDGGIADVNLQNRLHFMIS